MTDSAQPPSDRVRLRRKRERGRYERGVIDAILDEALLAHLGLSAADGQPLVLPMLHVRQTLPLGSSITGQFIGNDHSRNVTSGP